ncbi:ABC transporter substrate-binding protein [Marinococcus luteus]|uniref:ABC transporter substrate-binding protein n=1 Tax=Marinococcus luteus TaxID=1122204 RepID=UPI002ACCF06E|nr:ABC transporter substrate-binding protein [Marinococcus luteus]MDZ5783330.1 ABC transporter substrate-binding protein [Marinococcus luteus]
MKKPALCLIAFSALGLGGCSFESFGADDDRTEVEIMTGKVEINDAFEELAREYEEENPDVKIQITSVGGGSDYLGTLKSRFSSGDAPDVFSVAGPRELQQFDQYVKDLSDTESAETALDGSLEQVSEGEKVYGLPFNYEGYGLIYNKRIFEEAGVNADEIQSYEDLEAAVQTMDSQKEELGIDGVFAFPGKEGWVIGGDLANAYLSPEFDESGTKAYEAETVDFEREDEYQRMFDLQAENSITPVLSMSYAQQVEEYFAQGDAAIIQQGNWVYPSLAQADEEFANEDIGMMPIPVEGHEGEIPVGVPNYWAVNKDNDDQSTQEAEAFLDWMNNSEAGKDAVMNDFNFVPAYEGYDTSQISDPLSQQVNESIENDETLNWIKLSFPNAWDGFIGSQMQRYLSGDYTWDEAIEASKEEWKEERATE